MQIFLCWYDLLLSFHMDLPLFVMMCVAGAVV